MSSSTQSISPAAGGQTDGNVPSEPAVLRYNIGDQSVARNPDELYSAVSARCPTRVHEHGGFWILSSYKDVREAARRHGVFSSGSGVSIPSTGNPMSMLLEMDPPVHTAQRRAVQGWFTPGQIALLEDDVRTVVVDLLEPLAGTTRCDAAAALAQPIPPIVMCLLFGLPSSEWPLIRERSERMMACALADDIPAAYEAAMAIVGSVVGALADRRQDPRDDLLTRILGVELDGEKLSDEMAAALAFILLQAGHETTVGGLGGMIRLLATNPEAQHRLREDPTLIASAVEECLRLEAPIPGLGRTLLSDTDVNGCPMHAGDRALLMWAAANRDGDVFEDPLEFRIDRRNNSHLTFGSGIHRCLGAPLARLELRVLMEEMLARIPQWHLEDEDQITARWAVTRSYSALPIAW